jgi:hypothetical protein
MSILAFRTLRSVPMISPSLKRLGARDSEVLGTQRGGVVVRELPPFDFNSTMLTFFSIWSYRSSGRRRAPPGRRVGRRAHGEKSIEFHPLTYESLSLLRRPSIQVLRICPEDSFGRHVPLASLLARLERYSDALSLCQKWFHPADPQDLGGTAFDPSHRDLLSGVGWTRWSRSARRIWGCKVRSSTRRHSRRERLWGDCPESRQYLELAVRINPLIFFADRNPQYAHIHLHSHLFR